MALAWWLILGMICVIVELATPGTFFFICFGAAAFLTALLASPFVKVPWLQFAKLPWGQWLVFLTASGVFLLLTRPIAKWLTRKPGLKTNVDRLIGLNARVIETINPEENTGQVRVEKEVWLAEPESEGKIEKGEKVEVLKIKGTRLVVKRV